MVGLRANCSGGVENALLISVALNGLRGAIGVEIGNTCMEYQF